MKNLYKIENELYIISNNENINENDYIITKDDRLVQVSYLLSKDLEGASKVILTTNALLIKDGVQEIDDEFLQWFIKNTNYEEVKVVDVRSLGVYGSYYPYKIKIPKEDHKQETFKEAKVNNLIKLFGKDFHLEPSSEIKNCNESFIAGAKWQKEQDKNLYSEDDLLNFGAFVRIEDRKEKRLFLIQDYYKKWKQI